MKIAIIATMTSSPWGGSEELWAATAEASLDADHEVIASVARWPTPPPRIAALRRRGARVLSRPRSYPRTRGVGKVMRQIAPPFKHLMEAGLDVICINQGAVYDAAYIPYLLDAVYRAAIPYVVVCHLSTPNWFPESRYRDDTGTFFDRAARVVFVSRDNLRHTERQLARTIPNAVVLRNPVNITDLTPVPWPASPAPIHLANVARLEVGYKGQDLLFEALAAPTWRDRPWRLRLYGEGPDRPYLEALARFYGIAHCVDFAGYVADIRGLWADNHILVLPSRAEGIPLALVEAMLCGRPAVVTAVGGNREWIDDGRTGFIAEAPTAASIDTALQRALASESRWAEMGADAHASALAKHDTTPGRTLLNVLLEAARR